MAGNIPCPIMGIFSDEDQNPSPEDVADLDAALTGTGVAHEFHLYNGAGHGFQDFVKPESYREEHAKDAWTKIGVFMKNNLG
jgi:carboxymethylenebutenolidase